MGKSVFSAIAYFYYAFAARFSRVANNVYSIARVNNKTNGVTSQIIKANRQIPARPSVPLPLRPLSYVAGDVLPCA